VLSNPPAIRIHREFTRRLAVSKTRHLDLDGLLHTVPNAFNSKILAIKSRGTIASRGFTRKHRIAESITTQESQCFVASMEKFLG
jgi:hypothetical protein